VLASLLLVAGPSRGAGSPAPAASGSPDAGPPDGEVAEHAALGHRLYQLGQYQEAVIEYRRAYELRADPHFLYEIAEAYRQLGATDQALFYYDRYLAGAPNAVDRDAVEDRVVELESLRARPQPLAPASRPGPAPANVSATPAKARPSPTWRRWWFWTAVGVALAAGVTAAALAGRSDGSLPATDLGDKRFY
jgi:tetratricopeptide (TPR) repeat protein